MESSRCGTKREKESSPAITGARAEGAQWKEGGVCSKPVTPWTVSWLLPFMVVRLTGPLKRPLQTSMKFFLDHPIL